MEEAEAEPGVFEAEVLDQRVRYTREDGLSTVRREIQNFSISVKNSGK